MRSRSATRWGRRRRRDTRRFRMRRRLALDLLVEGPRGGSEVGAVRGPLVVPAELVAADHAEYGAGSVLGVVADDPGPAAGAGPEPVAVELHLAGAEPEALGRAPDRLGAAVVVADDLYLLLAVPAAETDGEAAGPRLDRAGAPPGRRGGRGGG